MGLLSVPTLKDGRIVKMSKPVLLEALKLQDIIDLGLCMLIYNIVNDNILEFTVGTEFANSINLRSKSSLKVKDRKQLQALYLIRALSETIRPHSHAEEWIKNILKSMEIEPKYYESHSMDFYREELPRKNKEFKTSIDKAIEFWNTSLRHLPF